MEQAEMPALEIERELCVKVDRQMCRKETSPGRHGPRIIRDNSIVSMIHDQYQHRIFCGMQLGEVMFFDLQRPNSHSDANMFYSRHGSHKLMGSHAVCNQLFDAHCCDIGYYLTLS
jgi:hypothetical protein